MVELVISVEKRDTLQESVQIMNQEIEDNSSNKEIPPEEMVQTQEERTIQGANFNKDVPEMNFPRINLMEENL